VVRKDPTYSTDDTANNKNESAAKRMSAKEMIAHITKQGQRFFMPRAKNQAAIEYEIPRKTVKVKIKKSKQAVLFP
jgi:hypothetical protein